MSECSFFINKSNYLSIMENNFKRKLMAFWLFLLVGIPYMLAQSPMMVSGRITDDLGEPMIGVSVL